MRAVLVVVFALACMDYLARGIDSIPFLAVYVLDGWLHEIEWYFYRL